LVSTKRTNMRRSLSRLALYFIPLKTIVSLSVQYDDPIRVHPASFVLPFPNLKHVLSPSTP